MAGINKSKLNNRPCPDEVNECSSLSADTSVNEESADSDCAERCVVNNSEHTVTVESGNDSTNKLKISKCGETAKVVETSSPVKDARDGSTGSNNCLPILTVKFRDQDTARKYRRKVKEFLKQLIKEHDKEAKDEECDISDLELDIWEEKSPSPTTSEMNGDDLFTIDTTPSTDTELEVPKYEKKFVILQKEDGEVKKSSASQLMCFNCLGNHNLKDCTTPRDMVVINRNRREFMNKHGGYPKSSRYHLDDVQRFAHFAPGQISSTLSKALGVSSNQLPRYIYHMRLLGYPPGWLEEAKVSHSGLVLFDSEGKEVADLEDEEGEIIPKGSKDKYDITKIISYPGFNVPTLTNIRDDCRFYNCPPMMEAQSKQNLLNALGPKGTSSYKKKKMKPLDPKKLDEPSPTQADMDVEDTAEPLPVLPEDDSCRFIPPLPKDTPPRPPPPPSSATESDSEGGETRSQETCSPLSTGQSSISSPRAQSPSLSDLEAKKRQLLAELEDGGSSSDNVLTQKSAPTTPATPSSLGRVKSVSFGTPILKSTSPYLRLPDSDKFSKDICDVINFENLPDATGKYEQMSGLIKKVRTAVARLQDE